MKAPKLFKTPEDFLNHNNVSHKMKFEREIDGFIIVLGHHIDFSGKEYLKAKFEEYFPNYITYFVNGDVAVAEVVKEYSNV